MALAIIGNGSAPYSLVNGALLQNGVNSKGVGVPHVISFAGIDGLVVAATGIFTVPTGYSYVLKSATVRLTSLTGAATVGVARIRNTTDGVDLIANTTLTGLTATTLVFNLEPAAASAFAPAGKVISLDLTTAYTVATVVALSVDLHGYLF